MEIHSPDAIENAPATNPATPARITMLLSWRAAGDAHHQREVRDETVVDAEHGGPQRAADAGTVAAFGTRDAAAGGDALHRRDRAARAASCFAIVSVASASSR